MNVALILGNGIGSRVGYSIPKQFIKVHNKEIIAYTIEQFEKNVNIDYIAIVCHPNWQNLIWELKAKYNFSKLQWVCSGGETFQYSVFHGLTYLEGILDSKDNIVISFGVSPLTSAEEIDDSIYICNKYGNGISAVDVHLCTCIIDDEYSTSTSIEREQLKGFANPWTFKFGEVLSLYKKAIQLGVLERIEPHTTSLYLYFHKKLWFSKSTSPLIKITTPSDIELFKALLLLNYHD